MKLTSRGEYATRALFYLALQEPEAYTSIATIAKANAMPRKYLEQILAELRAQGILASKEGARGGYRFAVNPRELTLGRILRLLDGPMAPIECVAEDSAFECNMQEGCGTRPFWLVVTRVLDDLVDRVTFGDLVAAHRGERALFPEAVLEISLLPAHARRAPVEAVE